MEASQKIDRLLSEDRKTLPEMSPQLAGSLAMIGLTLLELKQFDQAEELLSECLSIREKTQPDHWTTFNAQSLLGATRFGQQKYDEATPLLIAGYEGMKPRQSSIPSHGAIRLPEALDRLIELYTVTDNAEELKKWQAEKERVK